MSNLNSSEPFLGISKFRSDELPHSFFGDTGTFELPRGTIVEFDARGSTQDTHSTGLAQVNRPILTRYSGYVRAYEEVPLPPDTALLRLRPVTALGLSELGKQYYDRDYGLLGVEERIAAQETLGKFTVLQLLEGNEPEPGVVTSLDFTVGVSESTVDLLNAIERHMDQQAREPRAS